MGQVALGFRSLLIKCAVFFVMAALLAWALGGTLWPRAEVADFDSLSFGKDEWFWRLTVGGRERGAVRWRLMKRPIGVEQNPVPIDDRAWVDAAGPIATDEAIYYAGRASLNPEESWRLERIPLGAEEPGRERTTILLPDRLAVERQLARIKAGLPVQDATAIRNDRDAVLDPALRAAGGP